MEAELAKGIGNNGSQRLVHVTLPPVIAAECVTNLGAAMSEVQMKQCDAADEEVIGTTGDAPFQNGLVFKTLMNLAYLFGCLIAVGQRQGTPIPHHFRVGVDRIECVNIVFTDPAQRNATRVEGR